jgi:hypothetical protein
LDARDEAEARRLLEAVNERIRYVNSHTVSGPPSTVWVVDVESILERRRLVRPGESPDSDPTDGELLDAFDDVVPAETAVAGGRRRRWWLTRRRA